MTKQEFLEGIKKGLSGLPKADIEERLGFYGEIIDDRIEDGVTEEAAVGEIGSIDDVVSQIIADTPFAKLVKEKIRPKRKIKAWEIVLLVLGSPVWASLLIVLFAAAFSVYIAVWAVIIALWSVLAAIIACGISGVAAGVFFAVCGNLLTGIATIGAGIFCAGLAVFAFFGCKAATKGILILTKKTALLIKNLFIKKGEV